MANHPYRYKWRREIEAPPRPPDYREEPIDVECMSVETRLGLIDRYAAAHPGDPVGDIVLDLFPELHRLRDQRRGLTRWHSYIGDPDDIGFDWVQSVNASDGSKAGTLPRRLIPREHFESIGVSVFFLMEQSRNGVPECRKLDWGAWGWKLTGQELIEFFGPNHRHAEAIAALDPNRHYVLVASEGV